MTGVILERLILESEEDELFLDPRDVVLLSESYL